MNREYPCIVQKRDGSFLIVLICLSDNRCAVIQNIDIALSLEQAKSCLLGSFYANQLQVPFYDEVQS
ncbi:hypothetical protein [Neisseria shayeganii]|uniref:Uncharacterized protein n=1 Tax=Neisseria shayeganii TaxID=607712 RepID=A0A7D7NBU9_9NEIS|nr:hypothetical protein [Neisseria shayeganii]QMT40875.1 hypothetical protein H3L94_02115 [Neisseria shayeganii]